MLRSIFFISLLFSLSAYGQHSVAQKELDQLKLPVKQKSDSIYELITKLRETIKEDNQINQNHTIDSLRKLLVECDKEEMKVELSFINTHASDTFCLGIIESRIWRNLAAPFFSLYTEAFADLPPAVKQSTKGKEIQQLLTYIKNSSIGNMAPDFVLQDINNKTIQLSLYKNSHYVLLDFWASWCGPCREDFPFLKELYSRYHSKGLEIINISRDENFTAWENAIIKDGVGEWKQINAKQNNSQVLNQYFIAAIPVKILINKEGKIIGRWRGGGEENKAELEKLLREVLR